MAPALVVRARGWFRPWRLRVPNVAQNGAPSPRKRFITLTLTPRENVMRCDRLVAVSFTAFLTLLGDGVGRVEAGLVSEWRFNETGGTTTADNIGGINGTLSGGATFDHGAGPGGGVYSGAVSLTRARTAT